MMNGKLDNIVEVNGSLLIEVIDDKIKLTTPNNSVTMPFLNIDELGDVSNILDSKLGSQEILLTSDIYDLYEYKTIRESINEQTIKDILITFIERSIQFIASIVKEEEVSALIVSTYNSKTNTLFSTIGLIDDVRIIFLNIDR